MKERGFKPLSLDGRGVGERVKGEDNA